MFCRKHNAAHPSSLTMGCFRHSFDNAALAVLLLLLTTSVPPAVSFSNVVKKDIVRLLFEIDDDARHARIHLPAASVPAAVAVAPRIDSSTKGKKKKRRVFKSKSVLDYEEKVEQMHLIKRANPTISLDDLDVIYSDDNVVVTNKPSGVLCVPDINKNPSLLDIVWEQYGDTKEEMSGETLDDESADAQNPSSMIVNRLDMDTSGLVVFGRQLAVTKTLNEAFRERFVWKEYEALLCGHVHMDTGFIDLPLQRDPEHPPFMRVSTPNSEAVTAKLIEELKEAGYKKQGRKKAKPSQTEFRVVERTFHPLDSTLPVTRIRLRPKTGRTHQLRVHCAAMGHPIVGDPTYGLNGDAAMFGGLEDAILTPTSTSSRDGDDIVLERTPFEVQSALAQVHPPNVKPMCLHAAMLRLRHPITQKALEWNAPVPF
jgi:tRNA pseudouridine32 synthase/23S rRNA pseudouridine746 synthase